ncbi:hypothetical protein PVAND_017491 [Polypedilum vanderplanki]|uniref:Thioredoxin n=1 Tax=Polypedilum vanderplanki TaxID=319348 RepID=S6B7X8_POLVA|nr:hypothetical protein PVAND_017491 [Polypedilum vanderplanki]BAN67608.1 thioredoxin [Polypedilum vanderplanki]
MPAKDIFDVKDERDFEERVLRSKEPIIISFDTPMSDTCKINQERLVKVVENGKKNLAIAKVDITQLEDIARKYDAMAVPTVAVACDGKIRSQVTGMQEPDDIKNFVRESLLDRQKSIDEELEFPIYVGPRYY